MKPNLRARPSVRDKVEFFDDQTRRAASASRERSSGTPTRNASRELMTRATPPRSYTTSSEAASSELDRERFYESSEDEAAFEVRSVPSVPSLPSQSPVASHAPHLNNNHSYHHPLVPASSSSPPPPPAAAPPPPPVQNSYRVTSISVHTSPVSPPAPPPKETPRAMPDTNDDDDGDDDTPPVKLDRAPGLLLVANTPKGRCVRAARRIPARTVVETCPVLVLDPAEVAAHVQHTFLHNYTYTWPWRDGRSKRAAQTQALPLGLGSLFNHSSHLWRCNVGWTRSASAATAATTTTPATTAVTGIPNGDGRPKDARQVAGNDSITYTALRDIEPGEELCISYGPADRLTFVDVDAQREAAEAARRERDERAAADDARARRGAGEPAFGGGISPLENLWVDIDALDIYSRIDAEVGS